MKTIVFIETNKSGSSYEAIKSSSEMLYYTVLLTNQEPFIYNRTDLPHVNLMKYCDLNNLSEITGIIDGLIERGLDIYAIASFIDPYCYTAALLSKKYGLMHFSAEAISAMLDKIESRKKLARSPYVPFFYTINGNDDLAQKEIEENLPLVLKASISGGSKDVYKAQTYEQYTKAILELRKSYPDAPILVEEFLDGPQYLVETVTIKHKTHIIAIINQEITFTGRFIVTGYKMITDRESEFYRSLKKAVESIVGAHGMKDGPCHLEIRFVKNEWKLVEINPRISGGAMNLFIETAYGINLAKETLRLAMGFKPDFEYKYKKEAFLQYVIVPQQGLLIKVTGRNKALKCKGVKQVFIKPKKGSIVIPPISMGYRYAYVIATGDTADEAMKNAKTGASQIRFHLNAIDANTSKKLSAAQKELLSLAEKNKSNIEGIDNFYDNFIIE